MSTNILGVTKAANRCACCDVFQGSSPGQGDICVVFPLFLLQIHCFSSPFSFFDRPTHTESRHFFWKYSASGFQELAAKLARALPFDKLPGKGGPEAVKWRSIAVHSVSWFGVVVLETPLYCKLTVEGNFPNCFFGPESTSFYTSGVFFAPENCAEFSQKYSARRFQELAAKVAGVLQPYTIVKGGPEAAVRCARCPPAPGFKTRQPYFFCNSIIFPSHLPFCL
jgi:hypothetical protein